jgi:hypothetical protein
MTVDVLYIAGAGRSGSTFLSLLLSQHAQTHNVGQMRDLADAYAKSSPCSCGRSVLDCAFWGAVVDDLIATHDSDVVEALSIGMAEFAKAAAHDTNWGDARVRARLSREHDIFLGLFGDLYGAAAQQAGGRMLIDSSKSVDLALALHLAPTVNLRILNLVRDPRAVAVSWSKVLKRHMVLRRRTRNWAGRQRRVAILQGLAPERFMRMRYEDFTASAKTWVADIQKWAGLKGDVSFFTGPNDADTSWNRAHLLPPANATVLKQRREQIHIAPATSWQKAEYSELREMAVEETFPFAKSLGYDIGRF